MKEKIKVSFIIPAYNAENTIEECINKILKISRKDIEVLVIDDGSKDKTAEICKSIQDSRIRFIHKENGGVSSARNMGIDSALGEYLLFCDADDWIQADEIEKVINKMNELKTDFAMYNFARRNGEKMTVEKMKLQQGVYGKEGCELLKKYVLDVPLYKRWENNILQGSSNRYLYRTEFLKNNNIRFDENIIYAEDLCFCVEVFEKATSVFALNVVAYVINVIPGSASRRFYSDFWKILKKVYKKIECITKRENSILYCHYGRCSVLHYLMNQPFNKGMELCEEVLNDEKFIEELKRISFDKKTWEERLMDNGCMKKSKGRLFAWRLYWKVYFAILSFLIKIKGTIKQ